MTTLKLWYQPDPDRSILDPRTLEMRLDLSYDQRIGLIKGLGALSNLDPTSGTRFLVLPPPECSGRFDRVLDFRRQDALEIRESIFLLSNFQVPLWRNIPTEDVSNFQFFVLLSSYTVLALIAFQNRQQLQGFVMALELLNIEPLRLWLVQDREGNPIDDIHYRRSKSPVTQESEIKKDGL